MTQLQMSLLVNALKRTMNAYMDFKEMKGLINAYLWLSVFNNSLRLTKMHLKIAMDGMKFQQDIES